MQSYYSEGYQKLGPGSSKVKTTERLEALEARGTLFNSQHLKRSRGHEEVEGRAGVPG